MEIFCEKNGFTNPPKPGWNLEILYIKVKSKTKYTFGNVSDRRTKEQMFKVFENFYTIN